VDPLTDGALDNLDQFHLGGPAATDLLIGSLGLTEGDRVLDIGSGFGGPARQVARRAGSHVTGIDVTPAYVHAARCLAPGAGLAVWEVCQPRRADLPWPMPWSLDGTDSFVATAGSLRASIEQGGFTTTEWTNETTWVQAWVTETLANGLPGGPALPMLLDDGYTRVLNAIAALGNGLLEVWRGAFTRNAG
jgi:SAM-dependent methyltransferase